MEEHAFYTRTYLLNVCSRAWRLGFIFWAGLVEIEILDEGWLYIRLRLIKPKMAKLVGKQNRQTVVLNQKKWKDSH